MSKRILSCVLLLIVVTFGVASCSSDSDSSTTTTTAAETTTTTAAPVGAGTGNADLDTYCESVTEFAASGPVDPDLTYEGLLVASEAIAEDPTIQGDEALAAAADECIAAFNEIPAGGGAVSGEDQAAAVCADSEDLVAQFEQVADVDEYVALEDEATAVAEAGASVVEEFPDQQTTIESCNDAVRAAGNQAASRFPVDNPDA